MTYKTELEARLHYLVSLLRYTGAKEGSAHHAEILANYNRITPLPRNHKANQNDSWCAIFANGGAWVLGYRNFPWECSCTNIRKKAKDMGIWNEGWTCTPKLGQWVIYDWKNDGKMDHIGTVCWIAGNKIFVEEGNYDNAVKIRVITVGDSNVEGFVDLDFTELVESDAISGIPVLRPVDCNPHVKFLQTVLKGAGYYDGELDASYGTRTKDSVVDFQAANGLETDGKAGPKTMAVITSGKFVVKHANSNIEEKENDMKVYNTVKELPEWAQKPIGDLVDMKIIAGIGENKLGLSDIMVRIAVMLYRGMDYIAKLCGVSLR